MKPVLLLTSALLIVALFELPIGYYTFLRIVVTIVSIGVLINEFPKGINTSVIVFGVIAILFNPLIPVYLNDKSAWVPIDIVAGVIFAVKSFTLTDQTHPKS